MRILRGQSNLEVSSQGFAMFVVGIVLATFLGGALRTVLSSDRVHSRIVQELKSRFPKHEFQIGQTEVLLSRGIWPGFGLRVHDLVFKQDVCGKLSFVLTIPQAVLPLDILSLRKSVVRLNDIEIHGGGMHLDYHDCPAKPEVSGDEEKSDAVAEAHPPKSIPPLRVDWPLAAKFLDGVELKNFTVTYEKNPTWKMIFNSAYLSLGKELSLQAQVDLEKSLPFGVLIHPFEIDLHADKNVMQWNFNADFKEGHVRIGGSVDVNTQAAVGTVSMRQVPIRDFMSEMFQMGFVEHDLKLKGTWLSCALKWEGQLQNYTANPIQMRDCRVEGGYGRAELAGADFWMDSPEYFKEAARFKVTRLQMQPVVEALNRQVLPAVLSRLGEWSGAVELHSGAVWSLDGNLENTEIVVANQSVHGKQVIDSAHTRIVKKGALIQGKFDSVKIHEGEFEGSIDFELNEDWRNGVFHVAVDRLTVSPSVQRLLVGGSIGPVLAHGEGKLVAGELSNWSGGFSTPEMRGEGWYVEALQIHSRFESGVFNLDGSVKSVSADSAWRHYPQMRSALMAPVQGVTWHDFAGRVEIRKEGGTVPSLTATEGGRVWRAKGSWVRDGEFTGQLNISGGKRPQTFSLRGEKGELVVQDAIGLNR